MLYLHGDQKLASEGAQRHWDFGFLNLASAQILQGCRKLDLRIGSPVKIPTSDISVNNNRAITYVNPVIDTFVDFAKARHK